MLVGVNFDLKKILLTGEQGRVETPISQFGGRFGVLGDPSSFVSQDDGIKDRVHGGLNLVVTYQKTGGVYTLDVTIQQGFQPAAIGFGEEVSEKESHPPEQLKTRPNFDNMIKCTQKTFPGCGCGGYHMDTLKPLKKKIIEAELSEDEWARSQTVSMDSPTPDHPVVKKFKSLYSKHAKSGNSRINSEPDVKVLPGGKAGFAGSGNSKYEYKGHKFDVDRGANGRGFSGTHHSITHVASPSDIKEERATKGSIFHHLTSNGFEYSPLHGDDTYHHPSGHSFYLAGKGQSWWHEHKGKGVANGGAAPGENVYDSALNHAKKLTDSLKKK